MCAKFSILNAGCSSTNSPASLSDPPLPKLTLEQACSSFSWKKEPFRRYQVVKHSRINGRVLPASSILLEASPYPPACLLRTHHTPHRPPPDHFVRCTAGTSYQIPHFCSKPFLPLTCATRSQFCSSRPKWSIGEPLIRRFCKLQPPSLRSESKTLQIHSYPWYLPQFFCEHLHRAPFSWDFNVFLFVIVLFTYIVLFSSELDPIPNLGLTHIAAEHSSDLFLYCCVSSRREFDHRTTLTSS